MTVELDARERRVLFTGLAVMGLVVIIGRGGPRYIAWRAAARDAAVTAVSELAAAEASVAHAPTVRDSLDARARRLVAMAPAFISGDTPALAASTLAAALAGAAATSNVRLGTTRLVQDTAATGAFIRVGVRADATGDVKGLTQFLLALERGPTLLVISEFSMSQPDPGGPDMQPEHLHIELAVEGLALRRGKEAR